MFRTALLDLAYVLAARLIGGMIYGLYNQRCMRAPSYQPIGGNLKAAIERQGGRADRAANFTDRWVIER